MLALTPDTRVEAPTDLVRRLRDADSGAMDEVVRSHGPAIRRLVRRIVKDSWAAEDITQEVFLRLHTHAHTLQRTSCLGAWLRRVARNLALTYVRDRRASFPARRGGPAEASTPAQIVEEREQFGQILGAVARLGEPFRRTFEICALEGRDYEDAAVILGCHKTTVNTRMFRTWRRLRTMVRTAEAG